LGQALTIRALEPHHWPHVRRIYEEGIATRNATLETDVPDWSGWDRRFAVEGRLIAWEGREAVGWGALSPVSPRAVYRGVAEVSVYVARAAWGRGVGTALLRRLVETAEARGIWTLQAGIFPENQISIHLHEQCGFRVVGTRERIGRLDGEWRDVVLLERRSREGS